MKVEKAKSLGLLWAVVLAAVVAPRLWVLGDYPYIDEGYYIYYAELICQSVATTGSLPNVGTANLYSCLLAPFCAASGNLFVIMRLVDLAFAVLSGLLLVKLIVSESGESRLGYWIALICLLTLNCPLVINSGAKNSFFCAFIPLLSALWLLKRQTALFLAGSLTALAVFLRETFAIYALLGLFWVFLALGFKKALRYALGGLGTGLTILVILGLFRGSIPELIFSYVKAGTVVGSESYKIFIYFINSLKHFFAAFWPYLGLGLASLVALWRNFPHDRHFYFWLTIFLAPWPEILGKACHPYHFSLFCLPLAGFLALYARLKPSALIFRSYFRVNLLFFLSILVFVLNFKLSTLELTLEVLRQDNWAWPTYAVEKSNTLQVGKIIGALPHDSLAVNGLMHFLYPLTRTLPPTPELDDLSRLYLRASGDLEKLTEIFFKNPPAVVVLGRAKPLEHVPMYTEELQKFLQDSQRYALVATVPIDESKNYGWLGSLIYQRLD